MYAAILIPNFELQCTLRAERELGSTPTVLIGEAMGSASVPLVRQVNEGAEAEGVVPGMSLPQAQARCPELAFRRSNAGQEAVATAALLQAAERISPYLEHSGPGCCTVDLRRSGEIDHVAWAKDLAEELQTLCLAAQIGISPTPDAALQTARLGRPVLMTADCLQTLAQLPVMTLAPTEHTLGILYDWGIVRVADLRALDRQQVAERLGMEGLALWDRAGGGGLRPLRLVRAAEVYAELAEFEGGVETLEPVLFRLRRSLEQLSRRLRADFLLAGAIELILDLDDRTSLARTIHFPAPTCEVDVLFRVLSTYLDTVTTTTRVNALRLRAIPSTPRDHQAHLWGANLRDPQAFSETLAQLSGIVGADRVGSPQRPSTHRPDQVRLEKPRFDDHEIRPDKLQQKTFLPAEAPVFLPLGPSLRRYRPPFRVAVESERNRPSHLRGRDLAGRICASAGPWRLDGGWWDRDEAWRWEEWDVELAAGGLYRLANHRQANWWMLGAYD